VRGAIFRAALDEIGVNICLLEQSCFRRGHRRTKELKTNRGKERHAALPRRVRVALGRPTMQAELWRLVDIQKSQSQAFVGCGHQALLKSL
jgi:hypothetical protein